MTPGKSLVEKRRPLTRVEIITLAVEQGGRCGCGCGEKLDATKERVIDEHVIPLELTGTNDLSNRALYRKPCAVKKTKADAAAIAKAKRLAGETCQGPRRAIPSRGFSKPSVPVRIPSRPFGTSKRSLVAVERGE
jgi:hypothetical protein